jgi:outer membrane protein
MTSLVINFKNSSLRSARPSDAGVRMDREMTLKMLHWIATATLLLLAGGSYAQAEGKVGYVNIDRILRDAAPALRAQKKIEAEFSKRDQEMQKVADQLKRLQDQLEKNAVTMSETDRRNKEREFNDLNKDFQKKQRDFRDDLNNRRQEELSIVLERANRAVKAVAEQEKYDIIFQEAVWSSSRIDITDKVIKALDDSGGKSAGK